MDSMAFLYRHKGMSVIYIPWMTGETADKKQQHNEYILNMLIINLQVIEYGLPTK